MNIPKLELLKILKLRDEGKTDNEICEELDVSSRTLREYLPNKEEQRINLKNELTKIYSDSIDSNNTNKWFVEDYLTNHNLYKYTDNMIKEVLSELRK